MSDLTYEASVYARTITYTNLKGKTNTVELTFSLDPIQLLRVMATIPSPKRSKSNNPARRAEEESGLTPEQQFKFLVDIASKAAGFISDDGESFEPFEDFKDSIVGKAFITKLASSDGDRAEFAQKVMINPFEAFVNFAKADESNSQTEIKQFEEMLESVKRIFDTAEDKSLSIEEKRAKLEADLAALEASEES